MDKLGSLVYSKAALMIHSIMLLFMCFALRVNVSLGLH